jgi:RHS repeat-associated protein
VESSYDSAGRLIRRAYPEATTEFTYGSSPGCCGGGTRPISIVQTPAGGGLAQSLAFDFDGPLATRTTWSGAAQGQYTYRYDNNFFLVGVRLNSEPEMAITRNADGLIAGQGPFTIIRSGPGGLPTQISNGTQTITLSYDRLGRVSSRTESIGAQQLHQVQLTYNNVGRIVGKIETLLGSTPTTYSYTYDAGGQLSQVTRDGTVVEQYAYDLNGNRISRQLETGPVESASYDAQDRLIERGGIAYQFDADGYLTQRGDTTFQYSAKGELLEVTLGGGDQITYSYDGLGRRVATTDATGTYQFLYGNPDQPFQVTAMRDPSGTLSAYYYDEADILFAIQQGATWYYVSADQVGTPRVVSDALGVAVKIVSYDSFGNKLADSNPSFYLPIGFAGGLDDGATGLVRFGLRDYDPAAGRWVARDPVLFEGAQANLYVYVGNNPINLRDPMGLLSVSGFAYDLVGAGATFSIDPTGVSLCLEIGVGIGAEVEVDLLGGIDEEGDSVILEGDIPFGEAGIQLDECGRIIVTVKAEEGPFGAGQSTTVEESGNTGQPEPIGSVEVGTPNVRLAAQRCVNTRW